MQKNLILGASAVSLLMAVYVWLSGDRDMGLFIGLWVPSILSLGVFLKKN